MTSVNALTVGRPLIVMIMRVIMRQHDGVTQIVCVKAAMHASHAIIAVNSR